nr:hypothetical protein [Pandoravirus massiliensis]
MDQPAHPLATSVPAELAAAVTKTEPLDEIERMLFDPEPLPLGNTLAGDYGAIYDALRSANQDTTVCDETGTHGMHQPAACRVSPSSVPTPSHAVACFGSDDARDNDAPNHVASLPINDHDATHKYDHADDDDDDDDDEDDDATALGLGVVAALDAKYGNGGALPHTRPVSSSSSSSSPPSSSSSTAATTATAPSTLSTSPLTTRDHHQHQQQQQQQQQEVQSDRGRSSGARRPPPPKTKYRDAPVPLDGRAYNPVRFQYDGNVFEHGVRPPTGEYREFSGHADENPTTPPHLFAVYVIDDTERKKGATKRCLLQRDRVRDIVWSLPERRDANGRIVHGVPPTPQDQYDVRIDPSVAGLPMSSVPVHNRTRVFLTVRNPPPTDPLIAFTVGPVPDPSRTDPFDFVRGQLASLGTPDAAAVTTTRGEALDMLAAKHDLVNLDQEVSLAAPARHMLAVRSGLVARGLLVKDKMFRERALRIGPMAPALLKREAAGLVDRCRAAGLSDNQIVLSAEMPLRTYVILRLCDLGSELYGEAYLADERFRNMFKDRGPAHLSAPQTVQLSDAFYWVYLAPQDQRRPEFEEVIRFYQQRGVEVRLKKPHVKSGSSVGRTSESGALRHFKPHSKATHSVLRSRYEIVAPSGEVQALRTVKPRAKTLSPSERNPAAARLDRIAAEAARRQRPFEQAPAPAADGPRLGRTGIMRFLKPADVVKTEAEPTPVPTLQLPTIAQVAGVSDGSQCSGGNDANGVNHSDPSGQDVRIGLYGVCPKPVVVAPGVLDCEEEKKAVSLVGLPISAPAGPHIARTPQSACPSPTSADSKASVVEPREMPRSATARESHRPVPSGVPALAAAAAPAAADDDIVSLHRKAIAFPDPVIVGAPPEGMVEAVLTWASVRDKIPDPGPVPAPPHPAPLPSSRPAPAPSPLPPPKATKEKRKSKASSGKAAKKERAATHGKRDKSNKRQNKKSGKKHGKKASPAAGERESSGSGTRLGKRQRDTQSRAGNLHPAPMPPPVDAATLLRLLPRQGEPLFLPIIHLLPPDGVSTMPGFGAPYVRLPCPMSTPAHGPPRVLLQQLPLVLPTTDLRHTVPITPRPTPAPPVQHHQPMAPPPQQPPQPLQQHQTREEQSGRLADSGHNRADWLNLLSSVDADA